MVQEVLDCSFLSEFSPLNVHTVTSPQRAVRPPPPADRKMRRASLGPGPQLRGFPPAKSGLSLVVFSVMESQRSAQDLHKPWKQDHLAASAFLTPQTGAGGWAHVCGHLPLQSGLLCAAPASLRPASWEPRFGVLSYREHLSDVHTPPRLSASSPLRAQFCLRISGVSACLAGRPPRSQNGAHGWRCPMMRPTTQVAGSRGTAHLLSSRQGGTGSA